MRLPDDISGFISSAKRFNSRPKWDYTSDARYAVFTLPLLADGFTSGLELRAKVSRQLVDRDALFQLEFANSTRERVPLWRCQWRPLETHTNKAWGPPGFELAIFRELSHHHSFEDNYLPSTKKMRSGLPAARPVIPDPIVLSEFIAYCGECFKIENMQWVEVPQLIPDLFWVEK
jgi:hypothetical protein